MIKPPQTDMTLHKLLPEQVHTKRTLGVELLLYHKVVPKLLSRPPESSGVVSTSTRLPLLLHSILYIQLSRLSGYNGTERTAAGVQPLSHRALHTLSSRFRESTNRRRTLALGPLPFCNMLHPILPCPPESGNKMCSSMIEPHYRNWYCTRC